jgi:TatD DNase family protein
MGKQMSLIDIGANLTNHRFQGDLNNVIARAKDVGVIGIIVTGTSEKASREALALSRLHPGYLFCTAGVHPHDAKTWNEDTQLKIMQMAANKEVVAIGECGLDYNRMFSAADQQLACFEAQLQLAVNLGKPVFLHQRDAHDPFFKLLKEYRPKLPGAVVHCFTGSLNQMREYLELDCYIGITGWVCDERRGEELRQAVKFLPKNRLMIETDAPFLTPHNLHPRPTSNRNEPMNLPAVLGTLSKILELPSIVLAQQIRINTQQFFGIIY